MKITHFYIVVLCVVAMVGCTHMDIASDYDPHYNYEKLETYAWLPGMQLNIGDGRVDDQVILNRVKRAVQIELNQKGYKKVANGQEDFLLGFNAALNEPLYKTNLYKNRLEEFGGLEVHIEERGPYDFPAYDQGVLVIDVIIPETDAIVWRGSAQANIQIDYVSTDKKKERLSKAVHKILNDFPPSM